MSDGSAIFVDTSIVIARLLHGQATKLRIRRRLAGYTLVVSSEVVKQEFKRRVLAEASYLLNQIRKRGNLKDVHAHVVNVLPLQQARKRTICLDLLNEFFGRDTEPELTERAVRYLRTLLKHGMAQFDAAVGHVIKDVGCACATQPVIEREPYARYDLGETKCVNTGSACRIVDFCIAKQDQLGKVRDLLSSVPATGKSNEISRAESFVRAVIADASRASQLNACLTVGDLIIAMESSGIPVMYTMNVKESQHFCRALGQDLVVCPVNPDRDEREFAASDGSWPMS